MPKIQYQKHPFKPGYLKKIEQANAIIAEYDSYRIGLTLRTLYYQFVSRNLIDNNEREYKTLGKVINLGRLCGLIDWDAITDRGRFLRGLEHWDSPREIMDTVAFQFTRNKWDDQPEYVECWIEKDALIGVIENVCVEHDVSFLACKGYASASEVWNAAYRRLRPRIDRGKKVTILYLGDHDPSGLDMTRDLRERLALFSGKKVKVDRLALNMSQIEKYQPPPNPTKSSDSRAKWYVDKYGEECWELDALDPLVIRNLIAKAILKRRDEDIWKRSVAAEARARSTLQKVAEKWPAVVKAIRKRETRQGGKTPRRQRGKTPPQQKEPQ